MPDEPLMYLTDPATISAWVTDHPHVALGIAFLFLGIMLHGLARMLAAGWGGDDPPNTPRTVLPFTKERREMLIREDQARAEWWRE